MLRTHDLLDRIGNPEKKLEFVHITGTAGKGTVSTMTQNVLTAAGFKTGLFISPFVTTSIERMSIDGMYIDPNDFVALVERLKPVIEEMAKSGRYGSPSYFECCLAMALLYYLEQKCDWVVLEVGLGGRYDATNVIPAPAVAVITSIDYDHTNVLGKTLTKIARDKAGIIKPGSQVIIGEARPHLKQIFREVCQKTDTIPQFVPATQPDNNVRIVQAISKVLNIPIEALNQGITNTKLPARFETMQTKPLVIIDGAHSPVKMRHTVQLLNNLNYKKLHVVLAIVSGKDSESMVESIASKADALYVTQFQTSNRKSIPAENLAQTCRQHSSKHVPINASTTSLEAVNAALQHAESEDLVLVTGSFFLAGEVRQKWYPEQWILTHRTSF